MLRPAGWLCAATPNKWGLPAAAARIVPNAFHATVLRLLGSKRRESDVFPTFYRMNTRRRLRALFPGYLDCSYMLDGPPVITPAGSGSRGQ